MSDFTKNRRDCLKLMGATLAASQFPSLLAAEFPMQMKKIPSSGEAIPVIGLGTARAFDVGSTEELARLREVLQTLAQVPNSMMDTSPMYGAAESVVGELVEPLGVRDQLFYATKVWTEGRKAGIRQMQDSMRLLKTDKLDLIQVHNLVDTKVHLKTLRQWQDDGKVRYIGITHYHGGAHDAVESVLKAEKLDFLQINYSFLEPEAADRVLPLAADKGVAVIVNRPFARGQLFRLTKGKALPGYAQELGISSWAQFFLKYVVSHPAVTVAIPGTSKKKHMLDNQMAGHGTLPDDTMRKAMMETIRLL